MQTSQLTLAQWGARTNAQVVRDLAYRALLEYAPRTLKESSMKAAHVRKWIKCYGGDLEAWQIDALLCSLALTVAA